MFKALGFEEADIQERFGHMIEAFRYGAPPRGGLAYGLDRLVRLMAGRDSIRDVIAFPKVQNASDLMMHCPSPVDEKQLKELSKMCIRDRRYAVSLIPTKTEFPVLTLLTNLLGALLIGAITRCV